MNPCVLIRSAYNYSTLAERCKNSVRYFHPDIPIEIPYSDNWLEFLKRIKLEDIGKDKAPMYIATFLGCQYLYTGKYDTIIMLDADTVVTGTLNEMLCEDYGLATSNSITWGVANAGVWAVRDKEFLMEYLNVDIHTWFQDNWSFSVLSDLRKAYAGLSIKDLDGPNSDVWYNERSREFWDLLEINDDKLYGGGRQIKVLHWAGGFCPQENKMSCSIFSKETKDWLNKIASTTTFTDYEGKEIGDYIINLCHKDYLR